MKLKTLAVGLCMIALLTGCGTKGDDAKGGREDRMIRIGASVTPRAEILKHVKSALEKKGYKVEIGEFTDYVKPNQALVDDELDVNFFQHELYLVNRTRKANVSDRLTNVFAVHFEPLGIYSNNRTSLREVADGQKISVPSDPTNGERALKLLADNGIITLEEDKSADATKQDIEVYNRKVGIIEMQAETCATSFLDVDFAVVNRSNTLNAKISDKMLVTESKGNEAAQTYANIIAVQTAHRDDEKIKDLTAALNTEDVKRFIEEKYNGIVVPLIPVDE